MTQKDAIAEFLLGGSQLTGLDGLNYFGTMKLSTRVGELEREGRIPKVHRDWKKVKTKYWEEIKVRTYQIKQSAII